MSGRPTDWNVLDLDGDPTPGDPFGIRELSQRFGTFAGDVEDATGRVRGLAGNEALTTWIGQAGDAYRDEIGGFPDDLGKLSRSYGMAASALRTYASTLDTAQAQADRALAQGREARTRVTGAQSRLSSAQVAEQNTARTASTLTAPPAASVPPPDPAQVAAAVRNHTAAQTQLAQARAQVGAAQDDLDAARKLALAAKDLREGAEESASRALDDASHAGIRNKGFWQKLGDVAGKVWSVTVEVCKVVVAVLGVVALIIGGPLAWIVFAAALIVLADTLLKYKDGKASLWDVGLAALACIPCTKGLTSLGELGSGLAALRSGEAFLADGAKVLDEGATALRGGEDGLAFVSKALDGSGEVGSIGDRLASSVPGTLLKALHSGSADRATLKAVFRREYGDILQVNAERFAKGMPGFNINCSRCVVATDTILGGGGVAGAVPVLGAIPPLSDLAAHFGGTFMSASSYGSIVREMTTAGPGARGIVYISRANNTAHVFNVVHDANGVVFLDGQTGTFARLEKFTVLGLLRTH